MPYVGNPEDWSVNDQQGRIYAALCEAAVGGTRDAHAGRDCRLCALAYSAIKPELGTGSLRFYENGPGGRLELPMGSKRGNRARNKVREVHAYVTDGGFWGPIAAPKPDPKPEPAPEPPKAAAGLSEAQKWFLAEARRIRPLAKERDIDHISYRPIESGMRMIAAGISPEGCLHAMTMHWDDADRRQLGIRPYDPAKDHPGGMGAYLDALVEARVDIYLFGEAGFGKSYWAKNLAKRRDVPYGFTPMTEGASVSWLLGRVDAQGFKPTKLLNIWQNGGVYLFDEADASDPNMLLVMNGPLASHLLENPVDQESYVKSPDCILIFAGNTDGFGATEKYGARNAFDFSTFDRIRMGRAVIGYDPEVEMQIALANAA